MERTAKQTSEPQPPCGVADQRLVRRMNPNRFVIGERVLYQNHVTGEQLGLLEVVAANENSVTARQFFGAKTFEFKPDGVATWSCNLSIAKPNKALSGAERKP